MFFKLADEDQRDDDNVARLTWLDDDDDTANLNLSVS